jgi:hypothetical protein
MTKRKREETDIQRLERLLEAAEERMDIAETEAGRQTAARTVLMFASELRKARKEERRGADELDEARVLDWFLRLETTRQGRFLRELQQRSKKGSGLA